MPTPHLGIAHVAPTQANKTITLNDSADALDNAMNEIESIAVSGTVNVTASQFTGAGVIRLTGTPGAPFTVNVPATKRKFTVHNLADDVATIQVTGGGGDSVEVAADSASSLFSDGADIVEAAGGATGPAGPEGPQGPAGTGSASNWSTPFRGATAKFTSDKTGLNLSAGLTLSWDDTEIDTDSFWDGGQPTRLTVPAGITKVRVAGGIRMSTGVAGTAQELQIRKNGASTFLGGATFSSPSSFTTHRINAMTPVLDVVAGDYFELNMFATSQTSETLNSNVCYFSIEVVETEDAVNPPEEVSGFLAGVPGSSAILVRRPLARATTFAASLAGSYGTATVAATAQTDFDVQQDGVSIGTMRFAAAAVTATFISASGANFDAGDVFSVVAPASPDATLANVGFVIVGTRDV